MRNLLGWGMSVPLLAIVLVGLLSWSGAVSGADASLLGRPLSIATLEYPPYILNTADGPRGPVVDLVTHSLARMGVTAQISFLPIARGQAELLQGEVDAFFSIKDSPARRRLMLFTPSPLFTQQMVFFVRSQSAFHFDGTLQSMALARVGVVDKTSYGPRLDLAFKNHLFASVEPVVDHETNFRKLLLGRVDAIPCSRAVGLYYLSKLGMQGQIESSGPVIDTVASYLVFTRKQDFSALAARFDAALKQIKASGEARTIWVHYNMSPQ